MTTTRKKRKSTRKKLGGSRRFRKRKTTARKKKSKRWGKGWILHLLVIGVLFVSAWILWLDYSIQQKFDGHRWALPARVFARPLELFPTKQISLQDVESELKILGYRRVLSPKAQGEFSANEQVINVHTRGFSFSDGKEPKQKISLQFSDSEILSIKRIEDKHSVVLARIEPVEIAKIYPAHHEDRVIVKLEDVPPLLVKTLLATEDRRFYEHHGIDPRGIARAILTNIKAMRIKQGASTLTQQLIKNLFLTNERSFWRKINEQIMAVLLEYRYEKNEILAAYLNEVFLGQDNQRAIHGFGLAAEYYFSAPLTELRVEQLALLVGMVKGPSHYEPRRHPERAIKRRNIVLNSLTKLGVLEASVSQHAIEAGLGVTPRRSLSRSRYPAFTELVRKQLVENYDDEDLRSAGLRIFTTLDPILQDKAERILKDKLAHLETYKNLERGKLQGAIIITDVNSGEIQAVVGGRDKNTLGSNRAITASRHVGSLIKPIIYLQALETGSTLATLIKDEEIVWETKNQKAWRPENYDKIFHGDVLLITALEHSYNAATVWLGRQIGLASVVDRLKSLGLERSVQAFPSLLLGAVELSPLDISRVYQTIANDGFSIRPRTIRSVLTQNNLPLQRYELKIERAIKAEPAYLLKYAMTEIVREGTAKYAAEKLTTSLPLAGKTGTTGELRDSWFAGFDESTLSVVWLGRDDNKSSGLTGSSGALRVWTDLMKSIPVTPIDLTAPENIEWYWVHQQSGKLTEKECTGATPLPFIKGTAVAAYESCSRTVDKVNPSSKKGSWSENIFDGWLN